jgi:ethanolamine utilization protein EutN
MQLARVLGNAVATIKHDSLVGRKLLLVAPLMADGATIDGDPLLVVDAVGAGRGDTVIITSDGRGAAELMGRNDSPVRWTTAGIKDS